jgi:hypothetical protein
MGSERSEEPPEQFCVVYPKYSDHPDVLFKASVLQRSTGDHHVFLMEEQLSVEQAVNNGATRLVETDEEIRLWSSTGIGRKHQFHFGLLNSL